MASVAAVVVTGVLGVFAVSSLADSQVGRDVGEDVVDSGRVDDGWIQTFGDPDYKYQTASGAKALVQACLQLAIDKGRISP